MYFVLLCDDGYTTIMCALFGKEPDVAEVIALMFGNSVFRACIVLLFVNFMVGIILSLWNRKNLLGPTTDWIISRGIPYLLIGLMVELTVLAVPASWSGIADWTDDAVWTAVFLMMGRHAWMALKETGFNFSLPPTKSAINGSGPKQNT